MRAWDPVAQPDDLPGIELCDIGARRRARRRRGHDRHRVAASCERSRSAEIARRDGAARDRSTAGTCSIPAARGGRLHLRGDRPAEARVAADPGARTGPGAAGLMEALLLAGGKAERLGEAAQGLPKPLVPVAGFPLAEYTVGRLVEAGVTRVIVACRAGQEDGVRQRARRSRRRDRRGRRAGAARPRRRASARRLARREEGAVLALNGDELLDVDFGALLAEHERAGAAATIVVAQVRSPFGIVELEDDGRVTGFREAPLLDDWVNSGVYVARRGGARAAARAGRPRAETFPELAAEGKLRGFRHEGVWLTVNTPKDLRRAADFMEEHPDWRAAERASAATRRMSVDSPNFEGLDRWAFDAAAGREAVGLGADLGRRRRLCREDPLRPRRPVAQPSVPPQKDESWYVEAGRAELELGDVGPGRPQHRGDRAPGACFRFRAGHGAPRHGARGHDDPRGLDAAPRRRRAARGPLRAGRHQRTLTHLC